MTGAEGSDMNEEAAVGRGLLNALPTPVIALSPHNRIIFANAAAQTFFASGEATLIRAPISDFAPDDGPLFALIGECRRTNAAINEYDVRIEGPKMEPRLVDLSISPWWDRGDALVITLQERAMARSIGQQLNHRSAARSLTGMARTMAHEIKNPLAGIRGAAQLLQDSVSDDDKTLATLIRDESDRILRLVDEMEAFGDARITRREEVNIHEVLERVKQVARSSFASDLQITERYDPSLPPVIGDYDKLVQVFLNLVKNASDAVHARLGRASGRGVIDLATSYRSGMRLRISGAPRGGGLPLEVSVGDNGGGVREEIFPNMFDPFVTDRPDGKGLGLALVAKLVADHNGVVECENAEAGAVFRVRLPVASGLDAARR
ncbi:MAG: ATP-binding protein [Pseudomonadota bacterium]